MTEITEITASHIVVGELSFRVTVPAKTLSALQYMTLPGWLQSIRGVSCVQSGEWRSDRPVWFEINCVGSGKRTRKRVLKALQHNPPDWLVTCTVA